MAVIRLAVIGFVILTIAYLALSWYSRSLRRERLENDWAEDHPGDLESSERAAYIADGMAKYENGLRKKLILLVYVVPITALAVLLYVINA